jgi:RimJ/RimL family protein N-acetyltransferase
MFETLEREKVGYVVIGGFARVVHGSAEITRGLDIAPSLRESDLRRLGQALDELGASRSGGLTPEALATEERVTLATTAGSLALIPTPWGTRGYDELRIRANRENLGRGLRPRIAFTVDLMLGIRRLRRRPAQGSTMDTTGAEKRFQGVYDRRVNVSLRPLEDSDLDAIFEQMKDPESVRMAAFTVDDPADRHAFVVHMSRLRDDPSVVQRVIDADGTIAGTIASFSIDDRTEVTYWVDRALWGRGIASAALRTFLGMTTERPLFARAASDNAASLRVLEKAGFQRIGVNRDFAPGRGEEIEETILRLD